MGQQQLLLLVLTVVVVGLSIASGIEAFGENQRKARQDQMMVQLMDIITKAQAWKMKPTAMAGGLSDDMNDFSGFDLAQIGLVPTEFQGDREIIRMSNYACLKVFPNVNYIQVNVLDTDCGNGSAWMRVRAVGTRVDDIEFYWSGENNIRNNGF
ncbi:MAG: hypothetical protein AAF089_00845 [Bacteroidota bacterium]